MPLIKTKSQASVVLTLVLVVLTLVLVFLTSGCLERDGDIPNLWISKNNSENSYPCGNLTRTDVATIPVLMTAIDEVLASSSLDQKRYIITQEEWDQIDQFFDDMNLPPQRDGYNQWYIWFEGTLLLIFLNHYSY
ncbi:MAG: hypothetical protein ACXADY_26630 [Candidatus Hodarchaeales archaeon]